MPTQPRQAGLGEGEPERLGQRRLDKAEQTRLVSANQGFVFKLAREYGRLGVPIEDLVSEGNIGLLQAARRFDSLRGTRFLTYAAAWVRKQILNAVQHHARLVRLPAYRMKRLRRMLSAERALAQQLGRAPNREELGGRMQTRSCDVESLQQCRYSEISLDGNSEAGEMWVRPLVDTDAASPEQELLRDETFQIVHEALEMLSPRERTVVAERYGLSDGRVRTLREVAVELGLSRERVRQIESTARLKIARHIACRPLRQKFIR